MKSTRPGARGMGRTLLACVVALAIALSVIVPGTVNGSRRRPAMSGSARYVDDSPMNSSEGPSMYNGGSISGIDHAM